MSEPITEAPQEIVFLRLPDVLRRVPMGRTKWYESMKAGTAPKACRLGGVVMWPRHEIDAYAAALRREKDLILQAERDEEAVAAVEDEANPVRTALYRHYGPDGVLFYVGISLSVVARLTRHMQASHWANEIRRIDVEWLPSRNAARLAERLAIRREKPLHNVVHADWKRSA